MPYKLMLKHVLICSACLVGLTLVMPVIAGNLPQFTVDTVISAALPLFPLEINTLGNAQTGFNDAGQVAFAYALDNGEQGIALADVQFVLPDALFKDSFESIVP